MEWMMKMDRKFIAQEERMSKNIGLESVARLNPLITGAFASAASKFTTTASIIPWWVYVLAVVILVIVFWYLANMYWLLESPENVRSKLRKFVDAFNKYGDQRSSRKGLRKYITDLKASGVPTEHLSLTNFYVCSANTAAIFTPLRDGVASPEAIRLAIAAGARYLDIPIYSNNSTGTPVVCEMDAGSKWKRLTMNQVSFRSIMQAVQQYAIAGPGATADVSEAPYREDPLFIMLRFNGKPKDKTYTEVATVLGDTIESMRLDFTWNAQRGAERLFKTPITEFFGKIIIMSNVYPPETNKLNDYINLGPRSSTPLEMTPKDVANIPDEQKAATVARIQQNLTLCRPNGEEPDINSNGWDYAKAHALGIHFAAMNFWSQDANLTAYRAPAVFGVNSFLIKPVDLRYVIVYITPPADPNPALNAGNGTPTAPAPINIMQQ